MWNAVQAKLADNRTGNQHKREAVHPSLLAGKLFDEIGQKMIPSHANKGSRRYRYYISQNLQLGSKGATATGMRIPAQEIEALVCNELSGLVADPTSLLETASTTSLGADAMARLVAEAQTIAGTLGESDTLALAKLIGSIVQRIDVTSTKIVVTVNMQAIVKHVGIDLKNQSELLQINIPVQLKRSGLAMRLVLQTGEAAVPCVDKTLIGAIATAHQWWKELMKNPHLDVRRFAEANGIDESWVTRTLRLAFLDPAIVDRVLNGKAPAHFTVETLRSESSIPPLWSEQRVLHRISATI